MRKAVMPFVLSMGLIAVWAAPADAASTRAEYVAQVDPICQPFVGPENAAYKAYRKNAKRWDHLAVSGSLKAWLNATRRTSKSLTRFVQLDVTLVEQIAAVPPPAADAGTVGTWLDDRRQANALTASAAAALNRRSLGSASTSSKSSELTRGPLPPREPPMGSAFRSAG